MNETSTLIDLWLHRGSHTHAFSHRQKTGMRGRNLARSLWFTLALVFAAWCAAVAQDAPSLSAAELASKLSTQMQDGASVVRLKMETRGSAKASLQVVAKARRTKAGTDVAYQVLWPKERKGEGFVLRQSADGATRGSAFTPPDSVVSLSAAKMADPALGSAFSYQDFVENFFAWPQQKLAGSESIGRVACEILESRPGKGSRGPYSLVRSWIDPKRLVAMRVEKYAGTGQLVRRIETTRVAEDDQDRKIPATMSARHAGDGRETEIEGTSIRHDVTLTDADFTPEALRAMGSSSAAKTR